MNTTPEISVVMGVYNGAEALDVTIDSVLTQQGASLEFIIIDDGSTDATAEVLARRAGMDGRIRVVTQPENAGLTRALIAGCAAARGCYIARQDCGDVSLPGRLAALRDMLAAQPGAVMASCGTRFVGPSGEQLYDVVTAGDELQNGLSELTVDAVRGPSHHGATMFTVKAYNCAGGYRPGFRVAQDLDLWMRLWELGPCLATTDVLYQAILVPGAISSLRRKEQFTTADAILACARARRAGQTDADIYAAWELQEAAAPRRARRAGPFDNARFFYFLASVLRRKDRRRSLRYYLCAIRSAPFYLQPWWGLAKLMISP
jgi:glycosyltransferase involved in cell wall biosynthesis